MTISRHTSGWGGTMECLCVSLYSSELKFASVYIPIL